MSTASALEREIRCPASAVISPTVQESGEYAERGHEIHVFCRSVIAGTPRQLAIAAIANPQWRETCEQIDFGILCAGLTNVRTEVSYRIDTATDEARFLGINLNRRYPPRAANDVDGTNDFEGQKPFTGMWSVTDLKTGFMPVTLCKDNPQMKFHAKALMLLHDVDQVEARIAYIAVDGQIAFDVHVFTRLELDLFGDELIERRARIDRANEASQEHRHRERQRWSVVYLLPRQGRVPEIHVSRAGDAPRAPRRARALGSHERGGEGDCVPDGL